MKKEVRIILKNRAIAMAQEPEGGNKGSNILELVVFSLVTESYGIESLYVREVLSLKDFTSLPSTPSYILGIINVRGQILPVVDLKKFFNLSEKESLELNKVIIISDGQMEFGILADVVNGTVSIEMEDIQVVPPTISGIGEEFLKGVTTDNLIILNTARLLSDKSIVVNSRVN